MVVCQDRSRITLDWKTNTTPMRALNLRKFADMVGREKDGRFENSGVWGSSGLEGDGSSTGITC